MFEFLSPSSPPPPLSSHVGRKGYKKVKLSNILIFSNSTTYTVTEDYYIYYRYVTFLCKQHGIYYF